MKSEGHVKDETNDGEQSGSVLRTVRQTTPYSFSCDDGNTTEVRKRTDRSKGQGIKARHEANKQAFNVCVCV